MALVVDRFEYLATEIITTLSSARDVLAAIGTLYAARKSLSVLYRLLSTLKTYGIAPSWLPNLRQRYGEWAGWWAWHLIFFIYHLVNLLCIVLLDCVSVLCVFDFNFFSF